VEERPSGEPALDESRPSRRRQRARRRETPGEGRSYAAVAEPVSTFLFVSSVIGSVLAIGTVHTSTLLVVAAAAFGAVALMLYSRAAAPAAPVAAGPISLSLPLVTCLALVAYTLLQAVPLPIGVLRTIAPANADVWERVLMPFAEAPLRWASISLDPGASVVEALKWSVYAAVFAVAAAVSSRRGSSFGLALVFASAVIAALTTVGHGLSGATRVFGLYQPAFAVSPWHIGPLLNTNNLAGYLNLGAMAGVGLILSRKPIVPAWLAGLGVMLIVGVDVTSASRAGVLALPLGVITLALILASRVHRSSSGSASRTSRASTWLIGLSIGGGAVLALLGGTREAWTELYEKDLAKIGMLFWAKPLVGDHPWLGIGRGAFESVFPVYRASPGNLVYTHAENFPAQWASEWGIPVTIAAFVAFAWAFAPGRLGVSRSASAASGWVGVLIVLLQNMFDLALEVPAVSIALAAVLGSLWGDTRRRGGALREAKATAPASAPSPSSSSSIRAAWIVAAAGVLLISIASRYRITDVASDRLAIKAFYETRNVQFREDARALRAELHGAMLRHPAEPYFPLIGALVAVRARDQNPMPWLQHTLERGQINGKAHLLLSEVLHARGALAQALFELRLSVENDSTLAGPAALLAVRWTKKYEELLASVPPGKAGVLMLDQIAAYLTVPDSGALRSRVDRELIARDPMQVSARFREADARLKALEQSAPAQGAPPPAEGICADREACRRAVLAEAEAIGSARPDLGTAALLRARLLVVEGKAEEAMKLLAVECQKVSDRVLCLQGRVQAAARIKGTDRLTEAAKDLLGASCGTPGRCAEMATWVGDIRSGRGELNLAFVLYERAARVDPTEARWLKLADAASAAGAHLRAADALEQVARRRGRQDPELKKRIEEEQRRGVFPGR
jgi:hypothetical protein